MCIPKQPCRPPQKYFFWTFLMYCGPFPVLFKLHQEGSAITSAYAASSTQADDIPGLVPIVVAAQVSLLKLYGNNNCNTLQWFMIFCQAFTLVLQTNCPLYFKVPAGLCHIAV